MAEPFSIGASIIAVLQLTATVYKYVNCVKDSSQERSRLRDGIASACTPLYMLRDRLDEAGQDASLLSSVRSLGAQDGPLDQFKRILESLADKITSIDGKPRKLGELRRSLEWPFRKDEIDSMLRAMESQKSLFHLALQNDTLSIVQQVRQHTQELSVRIEKLDINGAASEARQITQWLSPLNFSQTQDDLFRRRKEGTGQWFLESAAFQEWMSSNGGTVWCPGIPGAGKTMITSIAVNHIREICEASVHSKGFVACIYINYKEKDTQSTINLLAAVWRQLVQRTGVVSDDLNVLYNDHIKRDTRPELKDLAKVLKKELDSYERIYVLVDALDECADDATREMLVEQLQNLHPGLNLMVTSRPSDNIARMFMGTLLNQISAHPADLRTYVESRIAQGTRLRQHVRSDDALSEDIMQNVVNRAEGMFLLTKLHMDALASKASRKGIRQALKSLPVSLDATYDEAMARIDAQNNDDKQLAEQVLIWISFAVRPLSLNELQEALAIEPGSHQLDEDNIPSEELLTSVCAGLVVVDQGRQVVRLCHYSTEEYLKRVRDEKFPQASKYITESCLTCLLYDEHTEGAVSVEDEIVCRIKECHFVDYAATNWGHHIRGSLEKDLLDLALKFLTMEEGLEYSVQSVYFMKNWTRGQSQRYPKNMNGLHIAADFGLEYIAKLLVLDGHDLAAKDSDGENALHKAAKGGHENLVRFFIGEGADMMIRDIHGWTALEKATASGSLAVVEFLLGSGSTISKGEHGVTALHLAARFGHLDIVTTLVDKGADVEGKTTPFGDNYERKLYGGRTPLYWAAANGYLNIVYFLVVHKGAKVDAVSSTLRTPLHEAIRRNQMAVVKLLLKLGASVHKREIEGWTPLHEAVWYSRGKVVQMLLDAGADVDTRTNANFGFTDRDGHEDTHSYCTPLHLAARGGTLSAFERLLAKGADITATDLNGRTAIHRAAIRGRSTIIEKILDTGYDIDVKGQVDGETALHKAIRRGSVECVTFLLERGADVTVKNILDLNAHGIALDVLQSLESVLPKPSAKGTTDSAIAGLLYEIVHRLNRHVDSRQHGQKLTKS